MYIVGERGSELRGRKDALGVAASSRSDWTRKLSVHQPVNTKRSLPTTFIAPLEVHLVKHPVHITSAYDLLQKL